MTVAEARPPIRVAVVVDRLPTRVWQRELVVRLAASAAATVVLLVDLGGAVDPGGSSDAVMRLVATRLSRARALRTSSRDALPPAVSVLRAHPQRAAPEGGTTLAQTDEASIRATRPDVLLWLASARPARAVLEVAPRGAWRFQFGRGTTLGTSLIGCPEHLAGEAVVEVRLLGERPGDAPQVLRAGAFATDPSSWARTRDRVLLGVAGWPALACRAAVLGALDGTAASSAYAPGRSSTAGIAPAARLLAGMAAAAGRKLWHHGFRHDDWNIGVVDRPVASFLTSGEPPRVAWAPVRAGRYAADPFGRWEGDTLQVLFEDYEHARGAASIARRAWRRGEGWLPGSLALDIGTHQSYPFLFEHDGRLWLLPESRAGRALVLYAADRIDGPWQPVATLDVPGDVADATMLRYGDRWWLFAVRPDRLNPATELGLWFADRPQGPWLEHPLSPILTDVRSARPGGPCFVADGELYRPAQDCSTGYGDRLAVKRVTTLTPERYSEELVQIVRPDPDDRFAFGLHTLTGVGQVTLVDGKRRVHVLGATRIAVRRRLRR